MTRTDRIRVLIADDNRAVRRGIRLQLETVADIVVIGEVANGHDAVYAARAERADVVLMDLQMPGMNGIAATRELMGPTQESGVAVIVMTSFGVDALVNDALDAGAVGYLLKSHDSDHLVDAIRAAARGEAAVSTQVAASLLKEFVRRGQNPRAQSSTTPLSAAEERVVRVLSSGVTSNEAIAAHLHVSVHTVRSQLQSALKKVNVDDRTQLALWGHANLVASKP